MIGATAAAGNRRQTLSMVQQACHETLPSVDNPPR